MVVELIRQGRRIFVLQGCHIIDMIGTINRGLLPVAKPFLEIVTLYDGFLLLTIEILEESPVSNDTGKRIVVHYSRILNVDNGSRQTIVQRIDFIQEVEKNTVSNLFLVGIMDAKE